MANHKSALKRIRRNDKKRLLNKLLFKTVRNAIQRFKEVTSKEEAAKMLPTIISSIDKIAKKNIIHSNKAGNLKSKLTKHLSSL